MSNAWVTCLIQGDNSWKRLLIPHNVFGSHDPNTKAEALKDGLASDEIVGEVTAHQVDDQ